MVYEDLLPGERTEMHAALAGELEERIEAGERGAHITAQVAHHWGAAGDQPRAFAAAARAGLAAERVNAFGEAQALFERALSLWERVPDPEALAGIEEFELLRHAAVAADQAGDPTRQEALLRRALQLVDAEADPGRAALIHERLSQSLWSQHRQDDSVEALREGLAAPAGRAEPRAREAPGPVREAAAWSSRASPRRPSARARRSAWLARSATARPRPSPSTRSARRSATAARSMPGSPTCASRSQIAREEGLEMEEGGAWINISDVLNLAGRTEEALEAALQGLETAYTQDWRTTDWLRLSISEYRFHLGDWEGRGGGHPARRAGGTRAARSSTGTRARAQLALGRGDVEAAEEAVAALAKATAGLTGASVRGHARHPERRSCRAAAGTSTRRAP